MPYNICYNICMGGNIKNLDLLLSRNKPLSISEFRKVVNDNAVSSVSSLESDKKYHFCYEIKLLTNKTYKVYVKMSINQIFKILNSNTNN